MVDCYENNSKIFFLKIGENQLYLIIHQTFDMV